MLDEVESCVKDIDTIQADMAEAKVILDEVKSFSPATLSAKITAFELLLSGLSDTITELKKTIPPSTPV
ncbi:MAG: hypothetical protein KGI25_07580, partial [Thaumarchaeota archaeon]|nr:hypothetical protein [Nitrososphaerota archaeon]